MTNESDQRYAARGVSAGKAEVHAAIAGQDQGLFPGAFCKILPDLLTNDPTHCLLLHADTAGSKSSLAYLGWREGLGEHVWAGVAQDALVMNLDDCGCIGALGPFLISNTIGRNAKRIPGSAIAGIIAGYQSVCDLLTREGIPCRMCGGETADVGDIVRTVDVGCTVAARLRRDRVVDCARMAPGDLIVGFASDGQAAWETQPNSGIGSNGLTSARHDALGGDYRRQYPETYAPELDAAVVYCGPWRMADPLPGDPRFTVGSALLSPTRTYLPLIKRLLDAVPLADLHGLIHCSGGGATKIGKFGRGNRYVKDAMPPPPPVFRMLIEASGTSLREAYTVWNMGVRLEAIVAPARAQACLDAAKACGIAAGITGRVEASGQPGNEVVVAAGGERFIYRM